MFTEEYAFTTKFCPPMPADNDNAYFLPTYAFIPQHV